jgi:hypothetical protein
MVIGGYNVAIESSIRSRSIWHVTLHNFDNFWKTSDGQYQCSCVALYEGPDCSIRWVSDPTYNIVFQIYAAIEVVMQFGLLIFCIYQLFVTFSKAKAGRWAKWSLVTGILITVGIGNLLRVIEYSVDPQSVRGIVPPPVDETVFILAEVLWIASAYCLLMYW